LVVSAPRAAQFKFGDQTLTVPDGFEVELVASTNVVQRPVSASFDDQGRLYVTDSSGSNAKPDEQLKNPTAVSCGSKTPTATASSTRASCSRTK